MVGLDVGTARVKTELVLVQVLILVQAASGISISALQSSPMLCGLFFPAAMEVLDSEE